MRTVELPDEIYHHVETAAAARGMSIVDYLVTRLQEDTPVPRPSSSLGKREEFPILKSNAPGKLILTKEMIDQVELEDDLRRSGLLGYE